MLNRRDLLRSGLALSASSLAGSSAVARAEAMVAAFASKTESPSGPRQRELFDFGWKFFQGHATDPARDLGFGRGQDDFSKSGYFGFAKPDFDDAKWQALDLPHDWAVDLPFVHDDTLQSHGYKPLGRRYPETSVGWYRRMFEVTQDDLGRRIELEFDGAFRDALVFVNGFFVGRNDTGYCPFHFDITDFINYGGKNAVVVRMDATFGDGWFYEGAGIYRHVWLRKTNPVHLGHWESYVRSEFQDGAATVHVGTVVKNAGDAGTTCRVRWTILDAGKKTVASAEASPQSVEPNGEITFLATTRLAAPALWSPETPSLYTAVVRVESNGKILDEEEVTFGVRTTRFDPDEGFFLNGKSVKIKGTCNHQDHAGVGAALPDRLQWFRLALLKEMGSNAVRTSHNMPTPEWVDACDRMGMMMFCETRSMSSSAEGLAQLATMIKRFRNSPSIIMWSMGNEEWVLQKEVQGERVGKTMVTLSHELDPTRLCSAAVNGPIGPGISKALDVEGFNYNLGEIDRYHKEHPKQPSWGSETASAISTRGVYTTDKLRNLVSAYDVNHPSWAEQAEEWWKFYMERKWLAGGFAWTGFDYRGEPTPYGWPSISSQFGILDVCGYPKDTYYYYKAWWGHDPVLHLFPHWSWQERLGEPVSVWVHSNLDEVELFLNGRSLGSKTMQPLGHLEWMVKYEPGVLEARGSKGGKVVSVEKRETTGEPATIKLTPDRTEIHADGADIAIVRVEVLDAQGRMVPTADSLINFHVTGEGILIGVGNGDPNCQESDKEPKRSLFNGLAQLIVRSTQKPGEIRIEAYTEDWPGPKLPAVLLSVNTKKPVA